MGHEKGEVVLGALGAVRGFEVGLGLFALGAKSAQGAKGGVGLAHHGVGLVGPCLGEFRVQAGFVGAGEALIGALGGDDEMAGDAEFHGIGGVAGGDLGDDGFLPALPFGPRLAWREGATDVAGELDEGVFDEGVGGGGVGRGFHGVVILLVLVTFQALVGMGMLAGEISQWLSRPHRGTRRSSKWLLFLKVAVVPMTFLLYLLHGWPGLSKH